jgi:hypothetical protein
MGRSLSNAGEAIQQSEISGAEPRIFTSSGAVSAV